MIKLSAYSAGATDDIRTNKLDSGSYINRAAPAPKRTPGVVKIAKQAAALPVKAVGWVGNTIAQPFRDFSATAPKAGRAFGDAVTTYSRRGEWDRMQADADRMVQDAAKRYRSKDPKTKISKAEFDRRLKSANDVYKKIDDEIKGLSTNTMSDEEMKKFAVSGLQIATLPLAAGKAAATGGKAALAAAKAAQKATQVAAKVPGGKAVAGAYKAAAAARPPAPVAGRMGYVPQTLGQAAKSAAVAPLKASLVTLPTAKMTAEIPFDVRDGKMGAAAGKTALLATAALPGGPVGTARMLAGKATSKLGKTVYGEDSLFASIKLKDGTLLDYYNGLQKKLENPKLSGAARTRVENELTELKVWHQYKLDETGGDVKAALDDLVKRYDLGSVKAKDFSVRTRNFERAQVGLDKWAGRTKEYTAPEGKVLRAVRFRGEEKNALRKQLEAFDLPKDRLKMVNQLAQTADWGQNKWLTEEIRKAVGANNWKAALNNITSKIPTDLPDSAPKLKNGYFPSLVSAKNVRANFRPASEITAEIKASVNSKTPWLKKVLEKSGLSTQHTERAFKEIEEASMRRIAENLDELGVKTLQTGAMQTDETAPIGAQVLGRVIAAADQQKGIMDIRQVSLNTIQEATGLERDAARAIRRAIDEAHLEPAIGTRGLGDRLVDLNMKFNPLARPYSRVQGVAKYQYNPFFRLQETIETELLAQGYAKGKKLGFADFKETQSVINQMKAAGLLKGAGFGQESAGALGSAPFISSKLTAMQERTLASFVKNVAENKYAGDVGKALEDHAFRDTVRSFVQYPSKGFLSSNAARTLNVAVFPLRYNIKVAMMATEILSKTSPITQVAVIKGVHDFRQWLDTEEGVKFQSENAAALGVLTYFTPLNSIESIFKMLGSEGDVRINDFGVLGGLPFGVIGQILQHAGVVPPMDRPYINPETGKVYPEKIPADEASLIKQVFIDIINSMYNFPGAKVGLPRKDEFTEKYLTAGMAGGREFTNEERTDLSPNQQNDQEKRKQIFLAGSFEQAGTLNSTFKAKAAAPNVGGIVRPETATNKRTPKPRNKKPFTPYPKRPKRPPKWLNGYRTTTARGIPPKQ